MWLLTKIILLKFFRKITVRIPPTVGISQYYCRRIIILWRCKLIRTRDHKSCEMCGTTGTVNVWRSEMWTVSKWLLTERSYPIYFRKNTHNCERNCNSKNKDVISPLILYLELREGWIYWKFYYKHDLKYSYKLCTSKCIRQTLWRYTVWQLHSFPYNNL